MAKYISLEALFKTVENYASTHPVLHDNELFALFCSVPVAFEDAQVGSIPIADMRPVVLCKDCRHRDPEDHKCDSGEMERQGCLFPVDDDYFCAYGER